MGRVRGGVGRRRPGSGQAQHLQLLEERLAALEVALAESAELDSALEAHVGDLEQDAVMLLRRSRSRRSRRRRRAAEPD